MNANSLEEQVEGVERIELNTFLNVGPVNVYLVRGDKLTLVDTGMAHEETWKEFQDALHQRDLTVKDIQQVVLTHHHIDHIGLLHRILEENPVPVYGHPNNRPWLRQDPEFKEWQKEFYQIFYTKMGIPEGLEMGDARNRMMSIPPTDLTHEVGEGDTIPGLPDWKVIETKGHAQSHISLLREKDGVLLAGDHLIKHISSNALLEPPLQPGEERVKSLLQYRETLKRCADMQLKLALSGHGEPIDQVGALVGHRLYRMEDRASRIKVMVKRQAKTCFQIVQEIFPGSWEEELMLAVSEVLGHLDLLEERGQIQAREENGVLLYKMV